MAKRRKSSKVSFPNRFNSEIIRWKEGDSTKIDPLFILVVNNVALETPLGSNKFIADMSTGSKADRALFTDIAEYIAKNLFGKMAGQAEKLLSASPHSKKIRFWSMYVWGVPPNGATSLVGTVGGDIIKPRRDAVVRMLANVGMNPDIVFIVTNSRTHDRAWSFGTTDDDTRGGIAARYDGRKITHRFYHKIPGMVAIHVDAEEMTAAHEFGHAFSSYTNGFICDLYVDGDVQFNRKVGRPLPNKFAAYQGKTYRSDKMRAALGGYPPNWRSYHSELANLTRAALMDNFFEAAKPMLSLHDKITKAYIMDRIAAKVSR
jgi:hypothetical protein